MAVVGPHGGDAATDRRGREAVRAHLRDPAVEVVGRRGSDRAAEEDAGGREIATVGVDRSR